VRGQTPLCEAFRKAQSGSIADAARAGTSAETVAGVIGTRGAWTTTERSETFLGASAPSGAGTRTRTREFLIHPDTIKHLPTGTAAVTSPGHAEPAIARMHHPRERTMTRTADHDDGTVHRLDAPLLTPTEAAQLLAVNSSWIYEAVRAGTLPCLRIGRHIRFTRTMLEEWLRGRVA